MATDARDFIKCLRMPLEAFQCLHKMLKVDIQRNKEMAQRRGDYVCTELRLYATLRYLGGGSVHDIRRALKTKKTSTYAIINQVCKAIIQCPALEVKFPQTQIECQEAAMGFCSVSHDEAIDNCVAAIDVGVKQQDAQPRPTACGTLLSCAKVLGRIDVMFFRNLGQAHSLNRNKKQQTSTVYLPWLDKQQFC